MQQKRNWCARKKHIFEKLVKSLQAENGFNRKFQQQKAPFTRKRFRMEPYQYCMDKPSVYTGTDGSIPDRNASGARTGPPRK